MWERKTEKKKMSEKWIGKWYALRYSRLHRREQNKVPVHYSMKQKNENCKNLFHPESVRSIFNQRILYFAMENHLVKYDVIWVRSVVFFYFFSLCTRRVLLFFDCCWTITEFESWKNTQHEIKAKLWMVFSSWNSIFYLQTASSSFNFVASQAPCFVEQKLKLRNRNFSDFFFLFASACRQLPRRVWFYTRSQ